MEIKNKDVVYDIDVIKNKVESETGVKLKLVNALDKEYIALGGITEKELTDLDFVYMYNSSYTVCPVYRLGANIEAIFNENILHLYSLT